MSSSGAGSAPAAATTKKICVIGFGAVGQAILRLFRVTTGRGLLPQIAAINFFAPEIKEAKTEGIFSFNPAPFFSRDNLTTILDSVRSEHVWQGMGGWRR